MAMKDPTLDDFYNDMNEHGNAEYKRVGDNVVVELDSNPTGWQITLWEAVKQGGEYVRSETDGNTYEWDAVARREYDDYDSGKDGFKRIKSFSDADTFAANNPYNGPRTPYHERD